MLGRFWLTAALLSASLSFFLPAASANPGESGAVRTAGPWTRLPASRPNHGRRGTVSYPIWSNYFAGRTPLHETITNLRAAGATIRKQQIATDYWMTGAETVEGSSNLLQTGNTNIGVQQPLSQNNPVGPVYITAGAQDALISVSCSWLYGWCDFEGGQMEIPVAAEAAGPAGQLNGDHHIILMDTALSGGEFDGYGDGYPGAPGTCNFQTFIPLQGTPTPPPELECGSGGFYSFSGDGLAADSGGSSGQAGGFAYGELQISGQELLNQKIEHAIAIDQPCTDDNNDDPPTTAASPAGIWPWYQWHNGVASDSPCKLGANPSASPSPEFGAYALPNARYGDIVTIKPTVDVTTLVSNPYCQAVLTAMKTYGAYIVGNTGSWQYGLALGFEDPVNPLYPALGTWQGNPWDKIYASLEANSAPSGAPDVRYAITDNGAIYFASCLAYWSGEGSSKTLVPVLSANDIEIVELKYGEFGTITSPPAASLRSRRSRLMRRQSTWTAPKR